MLENHLNRNVLDLLLSMPNEQIQNNSTSDRILGNLNRQKYHGHRLNVPSPCTIFFWSSLSFSSSPLRSGIVTILQSIIGLASSFSSKNLFKLEIVYGGADFDADFHFRSVRRLSFDDSRIYSNPSPYMRSSQTRARN